MFSNEIVLKLLDYLDQNLYKRVTLEELSNHFHFNRDYLMRIFKREIGLTIIDYMNMMRIYFSLNSLKESSSILSISLRYGFTSQEYYSEMFHHIMGVSPSKYRDYLLFHRNITEKDIILIQNHFFTITQRIKRIEQYRLNTPPKKKVLQYSIFK